MNRITAVLAAGLVALALAASTAAMGLPKLTGTVGPAFTITLKKGGAKVSKVSHGRYTIVVRDRSSIHNFHLSGPGLSKKTGVSFVGTKTWTVTLKKGTYKYVCDPHAASMRGSFRVT